MNGHHCDTGLDWQGTIYDGPLSRVLVPPNWLRVHHYVEMVVGQQGRCNRIQESPCDVEDRSLVWVAHGLHEAAAACRNRSALSAAVESHSSSKISVGRWLIHKAQHSTMCAM